MYHVSNVKIRLDTGTLRRFNSIGIRHSNFESIYRSQLTSKVTQIKIKR